MKRPVRSAELNPEFDRFLRAPINEDGDRMPVSVLSALARHDLDPWKEAAKLTELSRELATQRLSTLIAALSDVPSVPANPTTVAARLITLLPRTSASSAQPAARGGTALSEKLGLIVLFLMILTSLIASRHAQLAQPPSAPMSGQAALPATDPAINAGPQGQKPPLR
jgi:hypothetical protein